MTVEKPIDSAHVWLINATEEPIDVHINHSVQPFVTGMQGLDIGPEFQVQGINDTPYGVYTFSARASAPQGAVLASVSIDIAEGKSFAAVLHRLPDGEHQFSAYENDFAPSDAPRMTVRHNARAEALTWRIEPKDIKPEIPHDQRQGTLENSQWQVATNVVQNDYRLEVLKDGLVVAEHPDLELEHEKDRTVYIVGDPTGAAGDLKRFIIEQEFQLPRGAPPPSQVTAPASPLSTGDHNEPITFDCPGVEVWQTNQASTTIRAVDPDGVVTDLSIADVSPNVGGIFIGDHDVTPSSSIGSEATAVVTVLGDVPADGYEVTIVANRRSLGERATCALSVVVKAITFERLHALVEGYRQAGAIEESVAQALTDQLVQAEHSEDMEELCEHTKTALARVQSEKGKGIAIAAAEHLEREMKAHRANLGCQ